QQTALARIFANRVGRCAGRYPAVDLRPRLAAVVRAEEVWIRIIDAHRVRRDVRGAGVEVAGINVEDAGPRLDGRRGDVGPAHAAVGRHLDVAIVGAGPQHARRARRGSERGDRA